MCKQTDVSVCVCCCHVSVFAAVTPRVHRASVNDSCAWLEGIHLAGSHHSPSLKLVPSIHTMLPCALANERQGCSVGHNHLNTHFIAVQLLLQYLWISPANPLDTNRQACKQQTNHACTLKLSLSQARHSWMSTPRCWAPFCHQGNASKTNWTLGCGRLARFTFWPHVPLRGAEVTRGAHCSRPGSVNSAHCDLLRNGGRLVSVGWFPTQNVHRTGQPSVVELRVWFPGVAQNHLLFTVHVCMWQ